jgi:hypothetical protein
MGSIRRALVTITGTTGLLLHRNNPDWETTVKRWRTDPANKELNIPGDDRAPAWSWHGSYYHDGQYLGIPSDNLMTMLREGGAKVPNGKRGTLKRQTQSGIIVLAPMWPIIPAGKTEPVEYASLKEIIRENDYELQQETAKSLGFDVFLKPVRIGKARHLRARPLFAPGWRASGEIAVVDDQITNEAFNHVLTYAGSYAGLGDWRPSSPTAPGPYGQFSVEVRWLK